MSGKITRAVLKVAPGPIRKMIQNHREEKFKKEAPTVSKESIKVDLRKLGLKSGDTVNLHSSLKSIGYVEGGAKTVLEAIIEVITPEGTLMVPTFFMKNSIYKTCLDKNYVFDPRVDGTILGTIPSTFLKFPGVCRSIHPTHSVSAVGKNARYITESHHLASTVFGTNSPWDRLLKLNGKLFSIGLKWGRNTISHVVEEREDFPLPAIMKKTYHLKCKDWDGNLLEIPVNPIDPKYKRIRADHPDRQDLRDYLWQEFINSDIFTVGKVGQAIAWTSSANSYVDHMIKLMKEGITSYTTKNELKKLLSS